MKPVNIGNPLKYFVDIDKGIIDQYYHDFNTNPGYLPKTKKIMAYSFDEITGQAYDREETFEEYIDNYLISNSNKIIEFIYNKIERDKSIKMSYPFILKIKDDLQILINKYQSSTIPYCNQILRSLGSLNKELNNNILYYLELEMTSRHNPSAKRSKEITTKIMNGREVKAFNWIGKDRTRDILFLHTLLLRDNCIAQDTSIETLYKAFSGKVLSESLKIRWMILTKSKKHTNKVSLFNFLELLYKKDLIDNQIDKTSNNSEFLKMSYVFCDFQGNPLTFFRQSKQNFLKVIENKEPDIIEKIVNDISDCQ